MNNMFFTILASKNYDASGSIVALKTIPWNIRVEGHDEENALKNLEIALLTSASRRGLEDFEYDYELINKD